MAVASSALAFPVASEDEIKEENRRSQKSTIMMPGTIVLHGGWVPIWSNTGSMTTVNHQVVQADPFSDRFNHRELTNILVVVIRYFGGTLLGVGGLINAYRSRHIRCPGPCKYY